MIHLKRGIYLDDHKARSQFNPLKKAPLPKKVFIQLNQQEGSAAIPIVKPGDRVKTGTLIAKAADDTSSNIHSSVTGTVADILIHPHPTHGAQEAIHINVEEVDQFDHKLEPTSNQLHLQADEVQLIAATQGLIELGQNPLPLHTLLKSAEEKRIQTLIINGCESEPYLTGNHKIMLMHARELIKGIQLAMAATGAKETYFAIESNKMDTFELYSGKLRGLNLKGQIKPILLESKFPHGTTPLLVQSILKKEIPQGKHEVEIGALVLDVATIYALYEAAYLEKPLYERTITVSGSCVHTPLDLLTRIGTPVLSLIKSCGGVLRDPKKIIMGGPMMGKPISIIESPVIKSTQGIIALHEKELDPYAEEDCIRCGDCIDLCPSRILPNEIYEQVEKDNFIAAQKLSVLNCMECGICDYVCPSKLPLLQSIRRAKRKTFNLV